MNVAALDGIAEAEELEGALGVSADLLGPAPDQRAIVHLSAIERQVAQFEIEIIGGKGAVLDHHLIDQAFADVALGKLAEQRRPQAVAARLEPRDPGVDGDGDVMLLEELGVGRVGERSQFGRERAFRRDDLHP